ncbi:MAG: universal stress protein [Solirubrobacterales bacterium]
MIERILIGYDGSEQSRDALTLGAALADRLAATPVLAVCFEGREPESGQEAEDRAEALFSEAVESTAQLDGGSIDRCMSVGVPASTGLSDLASSERADLIAIGSTHRGAIGTVLPGSTALRLVSDGRHPLAIAPLGLTADAIATGDVAVAFDGSEEAANALRFAASLASQTGSPVRVLAALGASPDPTPGLLDRVGASDPADSLARREELRRKVEEALDAIPEALEVDRVFVEGSPIGAIPELEMASSALLVTGSHGRGPLGSLIHGSVSDALAHTSPWPLIVVPAAAGDAGEGVDPTG